MTEIFFDATSAVRFIYMLGKEAFRISDGDKYVRPVIIDGRQWQALALPLVVFVGV